MAKSNEKVVELPFPIGGIDEYQAYAHGKPFGTKDKGPVTQSALNVRGVDPRSGRLRGGVRSGLSKYVGTQINGSNAIQEIGCVVGVSIDVATDTGQILMGDVPTSSPKGWQFVTGGGVGYATAITLASGDLIGPSYWSSDGFLYVTAQINATSNFLVAKYDRTGTLVWSVTFGASATTPNVGGVTQIGNVVFVLVELGQTLPGGNVFTSVELWRFNATTSANLDGNAAWKSTAGSTLGGWRKFGFSLGNSLAGNGSTLAVLEFSQSGGTTQNQIRLINVLTGTQISLTTLGATSTTGCQAINVVPGANGGFYANYCAISGPTFGLSFVSSAGSASPTATGIRFFCYNAVSNRIFGYTSASGTTFQEYNPSTLATVGSAVTVASSGTVEWLCPMPDGGLITGNILSDVHTYAVTRFNTALAQVWQSSFANASIEGASVSYTPATNAWQPALPALSGRTTRNVAVAGGSAKVFTSGQVSSIGGSAGLSSLATVIFSSQIGTQLFFADGVSQTYYDSYTNQLLTWVATAGSLPVDDVGNKPRLICTWRGRAVLSGLPRDPQNWFMSAVDNPFDFDYSPATVVVTQAVAGNNSDAGLVGDTVNTLIPASDDNLIFGGDHTIYQMSGDPMNGGSIDRISDTIGMTWGRPWCKSPDGTIYFFGSRGGVYSFQIGGALAKMTTTTIDERLSVLDFSSTIIRMAWDDRQQGLHVFITPLSAVATIHLWYDARNQAWWLDQFANTNHDPLVVFTFDGDAVADRVLLMGSRDGYIRMWDINATNDDGTAIASNVYLGPIVNGLVKELQCTLSNGSGNVTWGTFTGSTSQEAIAAAVGSSGTFAAGRNRSVWPRRYGQAAYISLSSSGGVWALEQLVCRYELGTLQRARVY